MSTSGYTSHTLNGSPKCRQEGGGTPRTPHAPAGDDLAPEASVQGTRRRGAHRRDRGASRDPAAPLRLIAYCRVSTADQAANGVSLADQERRLRRYCEAHEFALVAVETDRGVSGRNTRRPAFQRALGRLRRGEADGLVAVKLDRLSRSIRDVVDLVECADRQGWSLHSLGEHLDTGSPQGRFVVHLFAALAQLEREQAADRTREAMGELRRQGRRISGRPPYGFRFDGDRVVEVPEEKALLQRMRGLQDEGFGAKAIATRMNRRGGKNPRTGRPWFHGTVRDVLA